MNSQSKYLQEQIKKVFISDVVDNFSLPDSTTIDEFGNFMVGFNFTKEQAIFLILNFSSEEEFKQAFLEEVEKRNS